MTATTTEVKHTPLPWSYHPICDAGTRIIAGKQGPPVAYMPDPGDYGVGYIPEHAANADLIVHAVNSHADLLAACKALVAAFENVDFHYPDDSWLGSEYEAAKAAIAKAEG